MSLTPILVASSLHQLRRAAGLLANHTAVIAIDDLDLSTMTLSSGTHRATEWLKDPSVRAGLEAAKERPVVLVEGRVIGEEERKGLMGLGVSGTFASCADYPLAFHAPAPRELVEAAA